MTATGVVNDYPGQTRAFILDNYSSSDNVAHIVCADGTERWLSYSSSGTIKNNYLTQIYGVMVDISERMLYTEKMEYQATHDGLTGLPNRLFFKDEFERVLETLTAEDRMAILLLDLDGFKEVNDTLGHATGDQLLQMIGPRINRALTYVDSLLARLGGDEFAIMIRDYQSEKELYSISESVVEAIKTPFAVNELDLR